MESAAIAANESVGADPQYKIDYSLLRYD